MVLFVARRAAASPLRAAMDCVVNTAAAISTADAKVTLVIRFRHMTEAKEARLRKCLKRRALRGISSSAFNEALASLIIGSLDTTLTLK